MNVENPFVAMNKPAEKYKITPEIERSGRYFSRKEKRHKFLGRILDEGLKPAELLKTVKKIIERRLAKQEVLRETQRQSPAELEGEYKKKYARIKDGDYSSTEEGKELLARLAREAAYYELNPTGEWTETDGEVAEREFARGVVMQKALRSSGLHALTVEDGNLDSDLAGLEVTYNKEPERLDSFDRAAGSKAVDNLFDLQTKVDRRAVLEKMKEKFGCQEVIFILEDIYDSWEGYKDNTNSILDDWENADEFMPGFKKRANRLIDSARPVFERYQKWDEYYLVNNDLHTDNLDQNALPINWERVGVTNNMLNVLINDYGSLRLDAWEKGEDEFVAGLDEEVMKRFRDMGDEKAGQTVIRLAKLRSFSLAASGAEDDDDERRTRLKGDLNKIF